MFSIHSVYYSADKPELHGAEPTQIFADTVEGLQLEIGKLSKAFDKPILYAGDRFPKEYIENQ